MKCTALQQNAMFLEDEVASALLFYHELGVFLFYPDIESLKSVVILEPQWLFDLTRWEGQAMDKDLWDTLTDRGILVEPL